MTALLDSIKLYHNFIFDMDGTLINSEIRHHDSWKAMGREFGFPELSTELLYELGGRPAVDISRILCERFGVDADQKAMTARKNELYRQEFVKQADDFPFFCEVLRELSAAGARIAVATSSHQEEARYLLEKYNVLPYVHALITVDMITHGKPNPEIYLKAAEALKAEPKDCLVFEDTVIGMQGIENAKMNGVKVFDGHFDCNEIKSFC